MRIYRLELHNYRCFPHLRLDFAAGLNVIKGPNGVGKSTVQRALFKGLFDRPTRTQANQADQAWGSPELYTIRVTVARPNGSQWTVEKNFETGRARLEESQGVVASTAAAVQSRLHDLIGVASDRLFAGTVLVRQSELVAISEGQTDITRSLEERVTGGSSGVDTQTILKKLDTAIKEYRRGYETRSTNPGPIAAVQRDHATILQTLKTLQERRSQQAADWARREALSADLARLIDELAPKEQLLEAHARVLTIRAELTRAREKEEELERLNEAIRAADDQLQAAQTDLDRLAPVSRLAEDEHARIHQLRGRLDFLAHSPLVQAQGLAPKSFALGGPLVALVLGLLAAVAGVWLWFTDPTAMLFALILWSAAVTMGVIALVWFGVGRLRAQQAARNHHAAMQLAAAQRQQEIADTQAMLQRRLQGLGVATWQEYVVQRDRAANARSRAQQAQTRRDTLVGVNRSADQLAQARVAASRTRRDWEERLNEPELQSAVTLTPTDLTLLTRERQRLSAEKAQCADELSRIRFRLEEYPVNAEELLQTEERAESAARELARRKRMLTVYRHTYATLSAARDQTIAHMRAELEVVASDYFARLTAQRYDRVSIDRDLHLQVAYAGGDDALWITPESLSCGTRDQLYFATRLALSDLIFKDNPPPLLLDDPFVTFDAERRELAVQLCSELVANRQVLLFTCSDDYDHLGHVIELSYAAPT